MTPKPAPSFSWDEIDALAGVTAQKPPEGAFTVDDYAAHRGLKLAHAGRTLRELYGNGKLQRVWWDRRWWYWKA